MTIPTEVLLVLIPLIGAPIATLWHAWRKAEQEGDACRSDRAADARASGELLTEQRIANVGALSTITFREFERDQHREARERCEREIDRMNDAARSRQQPRQSP